MQIGTRTQKKQTSWPVAYRLAAMGTLVIYTAIGTTTVNLAQAQDLTLPHTATHLAQISQAPRRFDIPAGTLDSVLELFGKSAQLTVRVSKEGISSLQSPGVTGIYSPEQALQKLLSDTGLVYRFTSATTVAIDIKTVATSVEVSSSVDALATSSPKYAEGPLETPQTITSVSQQTIKDQGVTTLRDALRNVAGISLAAGEGGAQGDNLTIRGFSARNDLFIDGMRDFGSYYRDPFNTQEVDVLQGPSSVTFGRGSTGGVVNQATKTPGLTKFLSGDIDFGTDTTRRAVLDFDHPVAALGQNAAFRLNVMGNIGNVAGRDIAANRRFGIAPSLAFGLGTSTRWNLNYFHQNADDTPDYGIPWYFNGPAPVNRHNYYGFADGHNYLKTYDDIGTVKVEHDLNTHVTLRNQVRYANYARDVQITEGAIATTATPTTPLDQILVTRKQLAADSTETYLVEQADIIARFKTAGIEHSFVAGLEGGRETSNPVRPTWNNVPTTPLLNPDPYQPFSGTAVPSTNVHTTALTAGAYFLETMKFGKHWDVSGGLRWDRMDTDYTQSVAPAAAFSRVDNMPSWKAAIVYKPVAIGSIYVDAGTSFNPSAESLSLSASTASLPPEKNRTYEAGTKWDFPHDRFSVRAALFQTTKLNAREPDPTNSLLNVLAGTQRVNGGQFEVKTRITNRWDLMGSYALLDAKVIASNAYPTAIGARLANVPRNSFNFWSTQRLPFRWETGFGGNFVSDRTASSTVPLDPKTGLVKEVPGYWIFSAMAKHRITEHIDFQVNVTNIGNRYYYDQLHPAHIVLGPGRSALAGLKFKF